MTVLGFRIVITGDFAVLGEYFRDNQLKFVETFGIDLRNAVNNNDGIDTIRNFWFLL